MAKKLLFFVLLAMLMTMCGCSKKAEKINVAPSLEGKEKIVGDIPCEFPLTKKKATLNIVSARSKDENYDDLYVWQKYEQMTNVHVNWRTVSREDRSKEIKNILSNNQQVDLIMRFKTSGNEVLNYGSNGVLVDLMKDDLLKKNAPNCWKYLTTHPDALASILNPDGTIYALPQVNSGAELRVSRKIYINKNWLKNINAEIPKTTEEFYNMLKAFKMKDANGNGDINDEIPFCPEEWSSIEESFLGAFGLGNRGQHNLTIDWDEANNCPRYIAASNEYKQFLQYFNKLYKEDLIADNYNKMDNNVWYNYALEDKIGAFTHTNLAALPADKVDNWVAIEDALVGPNGDKLWAGVRANFSTTGSAMIPTTCNNIELVLRWLDYFWTDEGTLFYHMGIEGETFYQKEDGTYDYMPYIYEEMTKNNLSFDATVIKYTPYPGGGSPTVEVSPYFMGGEMAKVPAAAARSLFKYGPKEYWPSFTFTAEEYSTIQNIMKAIDMYTKEERKKYIEEGNFDNWSAYVAQIEEYNVSKLLEIYQRAIDRYHVIMNTKYMNN